MEQEAVLVPKTKDIFDTSYFDGQPFFFSLLLVGSEDTFQHETDTKRNHIDRDELVNE